MDSNERGRGRAHTELLAAGPHLGNGGGREVAVHNRHSDACMNVCVCVRDGVCMNASMNACQVRACVRI